MPENDYLFKDAAYFDRKHQLTSDFGTRKAKSKMNAMKNNRVEEEQVSTLRAMNHLIKNGVEVMQATAAEEEEEEKLRTKQEILPDFDPSSRHPESVYVKESIIPKSELEMIEYKKIYKAVKKGEEYDTSLVTPFTVRIMEKLIEELTVSESPPHFKFRV